MVNTLFYVKYSLGPEDEVISETCCRLAQTKVNLMNKHEFMNFMIYDQLNRRQLFVLAPGSELGKTYPSPPS